MSTELEHANVTVSDADKTAAWMTRLFGWKIRWDGPAIDGGRSIHVGSDTSYLALYQPARQTGAGPSSYETTGGLNHLAVTVTDIDAMEDAVRDAGFQPKSHADYEPGRRFYFNDSDGIEFEIVQYD